MMQAKRMLFQIVANRKNKLLSIIDISWCIFVVLFGFLFRLANGEGHLAELICSSKVIASFIILLVQICLLLIEKTITYIVEKHAS